MYTGYEEETKIVAISSRGSYFHDCETILYVTWHVTLDVTEYWLYIYLYGIP